MKYIFIALLFCLSCKKESKPEYSISLRIEGSGNYQYQIGSENGSTHTFTSKDISGIAHEGDYVSISAQSDSAALPVHIKLDCDIAGTHYEQAGNDVKLFKQF